MALVTQQMIRADPDYSVIMTPVDQLYYLIKSTNQMLKSYGAIPGSLGIDVKTSSKENLAGAIIERKYEVVVRYFKVYDLNVKMLTVSYSLLNKDYMSVEETQRIWSDGLQIGD